MARVFWMSRTDDKISRYRIDRAKKLPPTVSRLRLAYHQGLMLIDDTEAIVDWNQTNVSEMAAVDLYILVRILGMGL